CSPPRRSAAPRRAPSPPPAPPRSRPSIPPTPSSPVRSRRPTPRWSPGCWAGSGGRSVAAVADPEQALTRRGARGAARHRPEAEEAEPDRPGEHRGDQPGGEAAPPHRGDAGGEVGVDPHPRQQPADQDPDPAAPLQPAQDGVEALALAQPGGEPPQGGTADGA